MSEATQPSLRRLARFDVHPRRELGQNFLIDSNILGVIERAGEVGADDVVLEIGGGLGVLSEYLAARVAHLHVVEIDRALEPALRDALDPFANTTLHLADAMALDLAALDPAPNKLIANLPYGIAASSLLRSIEELPTLERWVAMVQRDVGERLAAAAGVAPLRRPERALPARLQRARAAADRAHRLLPGAERRLGPGRADESCGGCAAATSPGSSRARLRIAGRRLRGRSR